MHSNRVKICMEPDKHKTCMYFWVVYDLLLGRVQLHFSRHRDVTRTLIGGGGVIHIFMLCLTDFFEFELISKEIRRA